jgi:hypothetical protein
VSIIDRKRISAVTALEALGYRYDSGSWQRPAMSNPGAPDGDTILGLLHDRVDALAGCCEASAEDEERNALGAAIEAYERSRWPDGKVPGGKG